MLKSFNNSLKKDFKRHVNDVAHQNQRGSSTTRFIIVLIALIFVGYGGFNYIVVSYQMSHLKEKMQEIITQAYSLPNNKNLNDPELIRQKIRSIADYDGVPADAVITVSRLPGGTQAQVVYTRDVSILPFNMYKYRFQFDHTAKPPTMFEVK